jgi:hypothetical protein
MPPNSAPGVSWEFPAFDERGAFGPNPEVWTFNAAGEILAGRPMTRDEQTNELFDDTGSDWRAFRAWLERTNPVSFSVLEQFVRTWE